MARMTITVIVGLAMLMLFVGCSGDMGVRAQAIRDIEAHGGQVLVKEDGKIWVNGLLSSRGHVGWTDADFAKVFPFLMKLQRVDRLELSASPIGDESLKLVSELPHLSEFVMQCPSRNVTDEGLFYLMKRKELKAINVGPANGVRWDCLERVRELSELEELHIFGSDADDETIRFLSHHPSLKRLRLGGTKITSESVRVLVTIPQLESVEYNKSLDDSALLLLCGAGNLQEVYVSGTKVTASGLAEFKRQRPDVMIQDENMLELLNVNESR
jgi:hypothetical protein